MRLLIAVAAALALTPAAAEAFTPAPGSYAGGDDRGNRPVHFSLEGHYVRGWRLDNRIDVTRASVDGHHRFDVVDGHHHLKGHWTDARHVVGTYSYYRRASRGGLVHVVIHWTAALAR